MTGNRKSPPFTPRDNEGNRLSGRMRRYARVGANVGGIAARFAGNWISGGGGSPKNAAELAAALGGLKGPLMKVAQMLATIPDLLPPEYAEQLGQLQAQAPPMGWPFVKRRMAAELGSDWQQRFAVFEHKAAAAASLGQVHRARSHEGRTLACKLQYPDMQSAAEADLAQLKIIFSLHRRMNPAIDTSEIIGEIAARLREELDYEREARHIRLYRQMLGGEDNINVPEVFPDLSSRRLLSMSWLDGKPLLEYRDHSQEERDRIGTAMFRAWLHPFYHYGVIHGDPHLGNYTVFSDEKGAPQGINLLDFGCIRIFPPSFVGGVIELFEGLRRHDQARIVHAYEIWGFSGLTHELIDILNIWARFIYGPLLEDKARTVADGVSPGLYGRREAYQVHQALREKGPVTPPPEFVFLDRASVGLGAVLLHLESKLNYHRLFLESIENFSVDTLGRRQNSVLQSAGLAP